MRVELKDDMMDANKVGEMGDYAVVEMDGGMVAASASFEAVTMVYHLV